MKIRIPKEYPFLYETHLHTSEGSACALNTGIEMAKAAKKAGYAGIFVTNHAWYGNTAVDRSLPWNEWVHTFFEGYRRARAWGEENGLSVFFGYESAYRGTEFLIYGVSEGFMIAHPKLKDATISEQYQLISNAGGLVIQAHPYRKEAYIPEVRQFPEDVDGIEGINATHSSHLSRCHNIPEWDKMAIAFAKAHGLPMTAGSDIHSTCLFGGGMAFKRRLLKAEDFVNAVKNGEDYILTNGDAWFYKDGSPYKA